ncbi:MULTISPECIES: hypothetical protein [Streptomyces]|uniref:hypothetical protein n=1 Tax=Streptomyces TaxID=1883 RepID=UPI000B0FAA37|nr:hypothetical protein [Streptomyces sp. SID7805]MYU55331.1 hypothetical protein [Streptomyces sp. SID7805]
MKTATRLTASLALGMALAATTAAVPGDATAAPHPHQIRAARSVTLTNADDGRTVTVARGDTVTVKLTGIRDQGVRWAWSEPAATAPGVLRRSRGGTSPDGGASAVFRAVGRGTSDVTAYRRCVAAPGHVCPRIVIRWRAAVVVK